MQRESGPRLQWFMGKKQRYLFFHQSHEPAKLQQKNTPVLTSDLSLFCSISRASQPGGKLLPPHTPAEALWTNQSQGNVAVWNF